MMMVRDYNPINKMGTVIYMDRNKQMENLMRDGIFLWFQSTSLQNAY